MSSRFTRYIFGDYFSKEKNIVKPGAFDLGNRANLSVYHTEKLEESEIWHIGHEFVEKLRPDGRKFKARGDFDKSIVEELGFIELVHRPHPHDRHYQIEKWPTEEILITRIKHTLATKSKLVILTEH